MEPSKLPERAPTRDTPPAGELLVLNGRQSGVRQALTMPVTLVGRDDGCDVRLNVEGVQPFHCVLGCMPGEVTLRDLHSQHGTFVNGQRIAATTLRDGDLLDVGPFRFRVLLAPVPAAQSTGIERGTDADALRVQAAAVAAQQAALDEHEARLAQQQTELEHQREQVAQRSQALDGVRSQVQDQQSALAIQQVQFNTQREIDMRLLQDGWQCLEMERQRWRERRTRELAALRARWMFLIEGEPKLAELRRLAVEEQRAWLAQKLLLECELYGLNRRILHQRQTFQDQEQVRFVLADPQEVPASGPPVDGTLAARSAELDRLAGELADQRTQLVEQWERLARLQHDWQERREQIAGELGSLGHELTRREQDLARREHEVDAAERRKLEWQEQFTRLRRAAALAHARMVAQQESWQRERAQVLAESGRITEQAHLQLDGNRELRRKWSKRRRRELDALRKDRQELEALRKDQVESQREVARQVQQLEAARRTLAEETQALRGREAGPDDALQRRWLAQNAAIVRSLRQQREGFQNLLHALDRRQQALTLVLEELTRKETALGEQQSELEQRENLLAAAKTQLEQEMRQAEHRRMQAESRLATLEAEAEQLARALIPDGESLPLAA
jgi:hypothetical protein